ncbi:LysR family transcriptional regulator [Bacillus sp. USDA818B3_A]|uniref:LysR family transcriptional regulator n=1 Tax=Bacillus sp. USDA818B3_A TaxID=2698834 RepID=UPI00136FC69F|nr:LysR family transcriptional regulator [Bacillus sp. USDA818B3_A]
MPLELNLEYYRAFYYVGRLNSISKAADTLFLSQPAVTQSIKKLENHFECKLFSRTAKGMILTNEGEILFSHVTKAMEELMTGEKELNRMIKFEIGKLEIGATETALYHYLIPKIEAFRRSHSDIYMNVVGSSTPEIIHMLRNGNVDLAFAVSPIPDAEDLIITKVSDFRDILIAGSAYNNLQNRIVSINEVSELPLVTVEKGTSAREHLDLWFEEQGILLDPEYSVRTSTTVLPFVERNLAIGIVPSMFALELIQQGRIFQLNVEKVIPPRSIVMMSKSDSKMSLLCKHFISYLIDC